MMLVIQIAKFKFRLPTKIYSVKFMLLTRYSIIYLLCQKLLSLSYVYIFFVVCTDIYQESPDNVILSNISTESLTFTWTPDNSVCPEPIHYIPISNCSTCIIVDNKAICNSTLSDVSSRECAFSVQRMFCGLNGTASNPIQVLQRGNYLTCS
jgi:hypothetical protein